MAHRNTPLALLALLLLAPLSPGQEKERAKDRVSPPIKLTKLSESCYAAARAGGQSNAGVIVGRDAVLVIDCLGSPDRARELRKEIARITPVPVRHVVLTHWHYDHSLGTQAFPKQARVIASIASEDKLKKRVSADKLLLGPGSGMHGSLELHKLRLPGHRIAKGEEIDLGGVKAVLSVAGDCHTVGDMVVYVASQKILFAGDLVWNRYHPNISDGSTFRWITALAHLGKLEIEKVVPGHGEVGGKELIPAQRHYLMTARRLVKHLARGKVKPEEIVRKLEIPGVYKEYGHAAWWPRNVAYIYGELVRGR